MSRLSDIPLDELGDVDLTCVQCKHPAEGSWEEDYDDDHGESAREKPDHTCDCCEEPICADCARIRDFNDEETTFCPPKHPRTMEPDHAEAKTD
jgi:hypothetical protein